MKTEIFEGKDLERAIDRRRTFVANYTAQLIASNANELMEKYGRDRKKFLPMARKFILEEVSSYMNRNTPIRETRLKAKTKKAFKLWFEANFNVVAITTDEDGELLDFPSKALEYKGDGSLY